MTSQRPKTWAKWLPLAEWWYNSSYNSAIKMSPFEALYGVKPRQMCFPHNQGTTNGAVEDFQLKKRSNEYNSQGCD